MEGVETVMIRGDSQRIWSFIDNSSCMTLLGYVKLQDQAALEADSGYAFIAGKHSNTEIGNI